jgi:hypothetical protein
MKIACLGWGSLIWDPRELPIRREWFKDGPFATIEFTRQSFNGRITLVIDPGASPVRILWAHMLPTDLQTAKEALRDREGIKATDWESKIGAWQQGKPAPVNILKLETWAEALGLDAVIWTALGPKFNKKDVSPSAEQVIAHLRELTGNPRENAKRYIERAPRQINTEYRRRIESALGWTFKES